MASSSVAPVGGNQIHLRHVMFAVLCDNLSENPRKQALRLYSFDYFENSVLEGMLLIVRKYSCVFRYVAGVLCSKVCSRLCSNLTSHNGHAIRHHRHMKARSPSPTPGAAIQVYSSDCGWICTSVSIRARRCRFAA